MADNTHSRHSDRLLVRFEGTDITGEPIHRLVRRGIVRTYQLSQLFAGFTVYRNVLSALHVHARSGFWAWLLELPAVHRHNTALAERALEIVRFVGLGGREEDIAGVWRTATSACCRWRWDWHRHHGCCCWTNRWQDYCTRTSIA